MAKLSKEVKMFIVQSLACHDTPTQVAEAVNEQFDIKIERQNVMRYDASKESGKTLAKEFVEIFEATRKAFLEESLEIPIASKIFRLRSLQRMHDYYVSKKNMVQAQAVLEQAAKEVGGYFTNKVKVGDLNGNPLFTLYQQIAGSSLPVAQDIPGEVIEHEPQVVEEPGPVKPAPKAKKKFPGRD